MKLRVLKDIAVRSVCDSQELLEAMEEQGSRNCDKMVDRVFEVRFFHLLHVGRIG